MLEFIFNNVAGIRPEEKETVAQVFPKYFSKVFQNTSYRTPLVAASAPNTVKCVQGVKLATLLKKDPRSGDSEPVVRSSSTK